MYLNATEIPLPGHVVLGPSTNPNLNAVASMIAQIEAEVDAAAAAAGYAVPISTTATIGYAYIVGLAEKGVTARILSIAFPNLPGGPGSRTTMGDDFRKEYNAAIEQIRKGDLPIVGAAQDPGEGGRQLPRSFSVSNPWATSGVESQVTVGMEF